MATNGAPVNIEKFLGIFDQRLRRWEGKRNEEEIKGYDGFNWRGDLESAIQQLYALKPAEGQKQAVLYMQWRVQTMDTLYHEWNDKTEKSVQWYQDFLQIGWALRNIPEAKQDKRLVGRYMAVYKMWELLFNPEEFNKHNNSLNKMLERYASISGATEAQTLADQIYDRILILRPELMGKITVYKSQ